LNLDTHLEDFKFWMAHELAHVFTPALAGKDEGGTSLMPLRARCCFQESLRISLCRGARQAHAWRHHRTLHAFAHVT